MSSSARTMPSPGATGRTTSIVPVIASWVYSIITTASAPSGSAPPVGTAMALWAGRATSAGAPMATLPVRVRYAGIDSEAPKVSWARTA